MDAENAREMSVEQPSPSFPIPPSPAQRVSAVEDNKADRATDAQSASTPTTTPNTAAGSFPAQSPIHQGPARPFVVQIVDNDPDPSHHVESSIWEDRYDGLLTPRRPSVAEEDVCYPIVPTTKNEGIDYEALDEYVLEERMKRSCRSISIDDEKAALASRRETADSDNAQEPQLGRKHSLYRYGERKDVKLGPEEFRFTLYNGTNGTLRGKSLSDLAPDDTTLSQVLRSGCFWIDILAPTDIEMRELSKIFHIHPLTMEDISMEESREKCDLFKNYYFICYRSYNQEAQGTTFVEPLSMYNVVMREGILSFHYKPTPHGHNVRNRIRQLKDFITLTPDWINYAIMDDITDSFAPLILHIETEADTIDDLVLKLTFQDQSDLLLRIGVCRKKAISLLRLLGTKVEVVRGLIKRYGERHLSGGEHNVLGDVSLYLGDIQDHILTMLHNLNHYEKLLARAHSNYLAQASVEMTQVSNETNYAIGKLTVFATVWVPMNIITGLWGMNVKVPGQDNDSLAWWMGIMGSLVGFVLLFLVVTHKMGLL